MLSFQQMNQEYFSHRIKQLRLSRCWTLEELVTRMGGIVTKQAVSKYEHGLAYPSPIVLTKLAEVFNVKVFQLLKKPQYDIEFVAYRKQSGLSVRSQECIESYVREKFEERLDFQNLLNPNMKVNVPIQKFVVDDYEDVEECAVEMRKRWGLGLDPIQSITGVLESNFINIIEVDVDKKFDGVAVFARHKGKVVGVAIVVGKADCGGRQRLSLAHELGHVVLSVNNIDEEKAAFRFGAAFLAPKQMIYSEVGEKRTKLNVKELMILKKKIGMSVQALIYRFKDLDVISHSYYRQCFSQLSSWGWRKKEPNSLPEEKAQWLEQNVYKALAEGLIAKKDAESLLDESLDDEISLPLKGKRSFMKLPLEERKRILAKQAESLVEYYSSKEVQNDLMGGDIVEQ